LTENLPVDIISYIYHNCEDKDTEDARGRNLECLGKSFSTAMKIRAAITSYYDGLTNEVVENYTYDEQLDRWIGNPSKAKKVTQYMNSLKKRKVQAGTSPNSMRAIRREDLMSFYNRCRRIKNNNVISTRQFCIYVFAFVALLRSEEVLGLRLTNIEFSNEQYITLTLDKRKDAPGGNVKPFILHRNDTEQFLCPVRAYLRWLKARGNAPGPLFLADKSGSLIVEKVLSYYSFKYRFEVELRDIGISSWNLYGTHSFRRGGCQYYMHFRGKTLCDICAWGGWDRIDVALRYMFGRNDEVEADRQEFTRPPRPNICSVCQRTLV